MQKLRSTSFLIDLCIFVLLFISAHAQSEVEKATVVSQGKSEYKLISTLRTSSFESELNAAAKQGYRLEKLAKAGNSSGVAGLVVRSNNSSAVQYEYKLLAVTGFSPSKKEVEEAVSQGFMFRGLTVDPKFIYTELNGLTPSLSVVVAIMERRLGETRRRFEYKFLPGANVKTRQQELNAAITEGFYPIDMLWGLLVLSRNLENPGAESGTREYRYLATSKISTMEKEMNKLAEEGYQFHLGSNGSKTIMSRLVTNKSRMFEYKIFWSLGTPTMKKKLLETARQGYIYLPTPGAMDGMNAVMERPLSAGSGNRQYEYKFLAISKEKTMQKELNEALDAGYQFLDLATQYEKLIVLGRNLETGAKPVKQNVEKVGSPHEVLIARAKSLELNTPSAMRNAKSGR
jgi:hypothetical protein